MAGRFVGSNSRINDSIFKPNAMLSEISIIFLLIPFKLHWIYSF